MNKELKASILNWLLANENQWMRVRACHEAFRQYIYDPNGNFIIGGKQVSNFITKADKLLYS